MLASLLSQNSVQDALLSKLDAETYTRLRGVCRALRAVLPAPAVLRCTLPCELASHQQRLVILGALHDCPSLCAMLAGVSVRRIDGTGTIHPKGQFVAFGLALEADASLNAWVADYRGSWRPLFQLGRDLLTRIDLLLHARDRHLQLSIMRGQCPLRSRLAANYLHIVDAHYALLTVAGLSERRLAQLLHCLRLAPLFGSDDQPGFRQALACVLAYRLMHFLAHHPLPSISPAALDSLRSEHWEFLERGRMIVRWLPFAPGAIRPDSLRI
jgi:hypothetical protein